MFSLESYPVVFFPRAPHNWSNVQASTVNFLELIEVFDVVNHSLLLKCFISLASYTSRSSGFPPSLLAAPFQFLFISLILNLEGTITSSLIPFSFYICCNGVLIQSYGFKYYLHLGFGKKRICPLPGSLLQTWDSYNLTACVHLHLDIY